MRTRPSQLVVIALCLALFALSSSFFASFADAKLTKLFFPTRLPREPLIGGMYWLFVDNFVFDVSKNDEHPKIFIEIHNKPALHTNISFALYTNEKFSFPALTRMIQMDPSFPCKNRTAMPYTKTRPLWIDPVPPGLDGVVRMTVDITEGHQFQWMLFLAACDYDHTAPGADLSHMSLDVHWVNPGGYFQKEFSWDQQSMLEMRTFFFVPLNALVLLGLIVFSIFSLIKRSFHNLVKVFVVSFLCNFVGMFGSMLHMFVFGSNGVGLPELDNLSTALVLASDCIFVMLLLLIANGWTITQFRIRYRNTMQFTAGALAISYASLFVWSNVHVPMASLDYIYCELPGLMIGAMRGPILVFFLYSAIKSFRREHDKKKRVFYAVIASVFSLWLLLLPATVIIAFVTAAEWRARVVDGVVLFLNTFSQIFMAVALVISYRVKLFLFHEEDHEVLEAKEEARAQSGIYVATAGGEQAKLVFDNPAEQGSWTQ